MADAWIKLVAEDSDVAWSEVLARREQSSGLEAAKKEIVSSLRKMAKRAETGKFPRRPRNAATDYIQPIDVDSKTGMAKITVAFRDRVVPITNSDFLVVKDQKDIPVVLNGIADRIRDGLEDDQELFDIVQDLGASVRTEPKTRTRRKKTA